MQHSMALVHGAGVVVVVVVVVVVSLLALDAVMQKNDIHAVISIREVVSCELSPVPAALFNN